MRRTILDNQHQTAFLGLLQAGYRGLGVSGPVLLAVSGGGDSTALLEGTARLKDGFTARPRVCCVDHGLRPESSEEAERVRQHSQALGLECAVVKLALVDGPDLEARARTARYAALEEVRRQTGCDRVATAHTVEDQAETLLMRLGRGTSLRGARGILPARERVIRPMLGIRREQVRAFLAAIGSSWISDPMNADPRFTRARVRARLLPAIEETLGSAALEQLAAFARDADEDSALLDEEAVLALRRLSSSRGIDRVGLLALRPPILRRAIASLLIAAAARCDRQAVKQCREAIEAGSRVSIGAGLELRAQGGVVRVAAREERPLGELVLEGPGASVADPSRGFTYAVAAADGRSSECFGRRMRGGPPAAGKGTGYFSATVDESAAQRRSRLSPFFDGSVLAHPLGRSAAFPLCVRGRRAGDRLHAPGIPTRKLQDLLVDAKVPRETRDRIPVVEDASGRIVCVVGLWSAPAHEPLHFFTAAPSRGRAPPLYRATLDSGSGQNS